MLFFAALGVGAYALLVLYLGVVEQRAIVWPAEAAKLLFLAGPALYISLTARAAERLRRRSRAAVRFSREVIERLREQSAQLDAARRRAEAASEAATDLLARVSHELRTPMHHVLGFAQLLEMQRLDDAQREAVDRILESGRRLLAMIEDVLDINEVGSGRARLELRPVPCEAAVEEAVAAVRAHARERAVEVSAAPADGAGAAVLADRRRLVQVLEELLANAVSSSPRGGRVSIGPARRGRGRIRISVADEGPGIPEEVLEEIFAPFALLRLDGTEEARRGTGLGLPRAKALALAMDGRLGAESEPGRGSTFWLELPAADPPADGS